MNLLKRIFILIFLCFNSQVVYAGCEWISGNVPVGTNKCVGKNGIFTIQQCTAGGWSNTNTACSCTGNPDKQNNISYCVSGFTVTPAFSPQQTDVSAQQSNTNTQQQEPQPSPLNSRVQRK